MACLHIAGVTCANCDNPYQGETTHTRAGKPLTTPYVSAGGGSEYERGFTIGYGTGFAQGVEEGAKIKARTTDCDICGMLVRTDHSSPESYFVHEKGVWVHSRCKIEQEKNS